MSMRTRFWLAIVALVVIQGLLYGAAVWQGEFLNYDDPEAILDNEKIASLDGSHLTSIFSSVTFHAYVPFYFTSLAIDRALFDLNPLFFHLGNVLLSVFNAAGVLLLAWWITRRFGWALLAAVVFSLQPVHAESVVWASGRKDVLSLALGWVSIWAALRALHGRRVDWRWGALSLVTLAIALLTKGTTLVLPAVLLVALWAVGQRSAGGGKLIGSLAVVAIGITILHALIAAEQGAGSIASPSEMLQRTSAAAFLYGRNLVAPFWLSADYPASLVTGGGDLALRWVGLLAGMGASIWLARRSVLAAVGLGWAVIALLPFNSILPRTDLLAADRYLYIPTVGAALLLVAAVRRLAARTGAARAAAVVLALYVTVGFAYPAWARTRVWSKTESLWRDVLVKQPTSFVARMNLALHLRDHSQSQCGAATTRRAPELLEAMTLLAGAHVPDHESRKRAQLERARAELALQRGDLASSASALEQARRALTSVTERGSDDLDVYRAELDILEGQLHLASGENESAEEAFRRAAEVEGTAPVAHHNLAVLHFNRAVLALQAGALATDAAVGDPLDAAAELFGIEAKARPGEIAPRLDLVRVALARDEALEARRQIEAIRTRWPESPDVYALAARLYLAGGDAVGALAELENGLKLEPEHLELRLLQADIWLRETRAYGEAKRLYGKILETCPGMVEAERGLAAVELARAQGLLQRGALPAAREAAEASMKIIETASAHRILGQVAEAEKDLAEACEHYEKVLAANGPEDMARESLASLYKKRGLEAMIAGRDEEKISFFEKAIRLRATTVDLTSVQRIVAEYRGEMMSTDESTAPPTIEQAEAAARDLYFSAQESWELGEYAEAEKRCRQSLNLMPSNPLVLLFLGVLQRRREKPAEAKASFEEALRAARSIDLLPRYAEAHLHLAELALDAEQLEEARAQLAAFEAIPDTEPRMAEWVGALRTRLESAGKGNSSDGGNGD